MKEKGIKPESATNYIEPEWLLRGAFSPDRVTIYLKAAEKLKIDARIIPREKRLHTFELIPHGMQMIEVNYGQRVGEFYDEVHRLSLVEEHERELVISGV